MVSLFIQFIQWWKQREFVYSACFNQPIRIFVCSLTRTTDCSFNTPTRTSRAIFQSPDQNQQMSWVHVSVCLTLAELYSERTSEIKISAGSDVTVSTGEFWLWLGEFTSCCCSRALAPPCGGVCLSPAERLILITSNILMLKCGQEVVLCEWHEPGCGSEPHTSGDTQVLRAETQEERKRGNQLSFKERMRWETEKEETKMKLTERRQMLHWTEISVENQSAVRNDSEMILILFLLQRTWSSSIWCDCLRFYSRSLFFLLNYICLTALVTGYMFTELWMKKLLLVSSGIIWLGFQTLFEDKYTEYII